MWFWTSVVVMTMNFFSTQKDKLHSTISSRRIHALSHHHPLVLAVNDYDLYNVGSATRNSPVSNVNKTHTHARTYAHGLWRVRNERTFSIFRSTVFVNVTRFATMSRGHRLPYPSTS